MTLWDRYKAFSPDFLAQHHDCLLYDAFHQIKAHLLYPLACGCKTLCRCEALRDKIVLSLNTELHTRAEEQQESSDTLYAMRLLLKIPEDSFFKKHYGEAYPLWLIQERFHREETKKDFKIIGHLLWALFRLAKTYELSIFREPRGSLTEAVKMILGNTPLKTQAKKLEKEAHLCGEKAYGTKLNTYKSVCHFIAAFNLMEEREPSFSMPNPQQIKEFLNLSHWFREKLLSLQTPNIKDKSLFPEATLLPLPLWITPDEVHTPIDPFEDKLLEINALMEEVS